MLFKKTFFDNFNYVSTPYCDTVIDKFEQLVNDLFGLVGVSDWRLQPEVVGSSYVWSYFLFYCYKKKKLEGLIFK